MRRETIQSILNGTICATDLLNMYLGDMIGKGSSRVVFDHAKEKGKVFKIELTAQSFSNQIEWNLLDHIKDTRYAKWFAPCYDISDAGNILIMKKCKPAMFIDELPKRLPAFFTDLKTSNFGFIGNQCVCFDYGMNLMYENGMTNKMRDAKWLT